MSIQSVLNARATIKRKGNTASGITATVADDSSTTITVSADGTILPGMVITVESEDLYVTDTATGSVTATRGANGTTAAAHTAKAITIKTDRSGQESFSYSNNATDVPCRVMVLPGADQFENGEGVRVTGQIYFGTDADIEQEDEITVGAESFRVADFDASLGSRNMAQVANVVEVRV